MKKVVKSISIILASLMLLAVVPFAVHAETNEAEIETDGKKLLLALDSVLIDADEAADVSAEYGVTVSETYYNSLTRGGVEADGEDPTTIYRSSGLDVLMAGVQTDLALTAETKYTIELELKAQVNLNSNMFLNTPGGTNGDPNRSGVGFLWTVVPSEDNQTWTGTFGVSCGMYDNRSYKAFNGKNIFNNVNRGSGTYNNTGADDYWENYAGDNGYTKFILELDGYTSTIYLYDPLNDESILIGSLTDTYTTDKLGLGIYGGDRGRAMNGVTTFDDPIASMINIKVYEGLYNEVKVVDSEEELQKDYVVSGTTLGSILPATPTPETAGNLVKWFYQGTNTMVLDSDKVTGDVVIEAKEINPATYTSVAGMQYTAADANNEQSVRFLARLYTLQASEAGFEVKAVYKDGETVKDDKNWDKVSTIVYTSVKATDDKTYTAEDLNAEYIIALAVDEVPTDIGQIDFYVRSYITVGGEKQYSEWSTFTMNNGARATDLTPLVVPEN